MDWHSVYEAYPVNRQMIWLNNCGTTPAGTHIVQAVARFMEGYSQKGLLTETADYAEVRNRIKTILANLLNCHPQELALIHNTAEGMNFISHGLRLEPEDEIILLENEYPSNVYPWLHWKEKGIEIRTAPAGDSPEDFIEGLERMINSRTRLIAISAVHWCTGMPFPLEAAGRLCRDRGIDWVTDGAQGVGMVPVDVKKAGISYMAFPAWKWLMGPLGLGVLYISQEKLEQLRPVFIGTESVVRDEEYLPYKSELKPAADRFTFSTANFNDWVYFLASLEFLNSIGFEQIRARLLELSAHFRTKLGEAGFQVMSDRFPSYPTGITVCEKTGTPSGEIMNRLKQHRIVAAERLGRIRFSPHIYNSPEQLEETVKAIEN